MSTERLAVEANKDCSSDPLLTLITITHSLLEQPFRAVLDPKPITSRGNLFLPAPFEWISPEESREGLKPATLRLDNVESDIIEVLRLAAGSENRPQVVAEFVFASAPDSVEMQWPSLLFMDARYDDVIDISLNLPDMTTEPACRYRFSRAMYPGLVY